MFVAKLKQKWTSANRHMERFEEQCEEWLNGRFQIPYLDEVSKSKAPEDEEPPAAEAPGPSFLVTNQEDQPPPAKKQKVTFLEKVRSKFNTLSENYLGFSH